MLLHPQSPALSSSPAGDAPAAGLSVRIAPDRDTRRYANGEIASFTVAVLRDGVPVQTGAAEVWVSQDGGPGDIRRSRHDLFGGNPFRVQGSIDEACFMLCQVWAEEGGQEAFAEEQVWYRAPQDPQAVTLDIRPDHPDGLYRCGEEARFDVHVRQGGQPVRAGRLELTLEPAGSPLAIAAQAFALPLEDGVVATICGTLSEPDFLYCRARWIPPDEQGKPLGEWLSVGFDPERIRARVRPPADLEAFWQKTLAEARALPVDVQLEPLDLFSNPRASFFRFSINTLHGQRVHGFLGVPTGEGPFPAAVFFPGAGPGWGRPIDVGLTCRGVLTLMLNVHPYPVASDSKAAIAQLKEYVASHQVQSYLDVGASAPDTFHFHGILAGFCRALDYLCTHAGWWDGRHLVFEGASQGGFLTLAMSGLYADKVTRALAGVPYLCDFPRNHPDAAPATLHTMAYYDPANLAAWIRCPLQMSVAFADGSCPPATVFSAFHAAGAAQKQLRMEPRSAHGTTPERQAFGRPLLLRGLGLE